MIINWDEMGTAPPEHEYRPYVWFGEEQDGHVAYFKTHPALVYALPKALTASTIGDSQITDNGTTICIDSPSRTVVIRDVHGIGNGTTLYVGGNTRPPFFVEDHGQNSYICAGTNNRDFTTPSGNYRYSVASWYEGNDNEPVIRGLSHTHSSSPERPLSAGKMSGLALTQGPGNIDALQSVGSDADIHWETV